MTSSVEPSVASQVVNAVVVGRESVGKSQFISELTGSIGSASNFRGSTIQIDRYRWSDNELIDTPGIHRLSDSETTKTALRALTTHDRVVLVVQATRLDEELAEMLPLVAGKVGLCIVTYWDKVQPGEAAMEAIERLSKAIHVPMICVDARSIPVSKREAIGKAFASLNIVENRFAAAPLTVRAGWRIEPKPGWLTHGVVGPWIAVFLLLFPLLATIFISNQIASILHPIVAKWFEPIIAWVDANAPNWMSAVLTAKWGEFGYGLLNMGPFLFVWALPTVVTFAVILGAYKASGLIEHINCSLHPWTRWIGLSGRDVVRVVMGFGCNVPAVISTRACSSCSRGTAVSAIAFGAACSYQLPATFAVLASASAKHQLNAWLLPLVFLGYLFITTLVYTRFVSTPDGRSSLNILLQPSRPFLQWPSIKGLFREAFLTLKQFLVTAIPVFALICVVASLMIDSGLVQFLTPIFKPGLRLLNLPGEAALPVVLSSIRKDGIFLFAGSENVAMTLSPIQTLTAVYLAGVLLPCVVTAWTIGRELGWKQVSLTLLRQATAAIVFAAILAWAGFAVSRFFI